MKIVKKVKTEKEDNSYDYKTKEQRIEVVHPSQIIVGCNTEVNDQRFDSLQTREEIVEAKIIESNDKSESLSHLEDVKVKPKWKRYKKRYSEKWENDPKLNSWIQKDSNNLNKVLCRFCNKLLRAHKFDLYKHASTRKHRKNTKRDVINAEHSRASIDMEHEDDDNDECEKEIVLSISDKLSPNKPLKREKLDEPVQPYIVVEASQNMATYSAEDQNENIFISYSEEDEHFLSKSPTDQEISEITNRIGLVLVKEIGKLLRGDKNILKFFKDSDETLSTDSNISRLTKICVGHLSQKYLVESTVESIIAKSSLNCNDREDISDKFKSIEKQLETTVSEMKALKTSFNTPSPQSIPLATIDLAKIFEGSSN